MKKEYCFNCGKEIEYIKKHELVHHIIHGVEFDINQDVYYCKDCGEEIDVGNMDEELKSTIKGYFNYFGINNPSDMRMKYNLTQELFAKIVGWSKKTIVRYENGQSLPQREYMNTYMQLNFDPFKLYSMVENKKEELNDEYRTIIERLKDDDYFKGANLLLYILKQKPLYRIQLIKNVFAIDTLSYKNNNKPITKFKYAHAPYGPVIDNFEDILNAMIKYDYITLDFGYNDKPILKYNMEPNMEIFDKEEIDIVNKVIEKYKDKTSTELSNISHEYEGWKKTKDGELIDYKYAKFFEL